MRANLFGNTTGSPSTSVSQFVPVHAMGATPIATESARLQPISAAFTLDKLYISLNNAPGVGKSYTFTIRKNQVDTAVTVVISGSATSGIDLAHSVSFAAGDNMSIGITPSGTPTAPTVTNWWVQVDSGGTHFAPIVGGGHSSSGLSTTVDSFSSVCGTTAAVTWVPTESDVSMVMPCAGTLDNLHSLAEIAPGAAKSYVIKLVKNGTATSLAATVSGTSKTGSDTSNSVSVVAGDTISISATPSGTPAAARYTHCMKFTPTIPGETFFGIGGSAAPSTTLTQYEQVLVKGSGYSTTEASRQMLVGPCMLRSMYLNIGTAPSTGKTRVFTLRRNAISSTLVVTISDTATTGNVASQNIGMSLTDLLSLQLVPTGTPAAMTGGLHLGVSAFIPVSTTIKGRFLPLL